MYLPAFIRYSPQVTRTLGRLEAARSMIDAAAILPAQEDVDFTFLQKVQQSHDSVANNNKNIREFLRDLRRLAFEIGLINSP